MSEIEHYEILVIGSGEAGKHLTWNLAQSGRRTAVVERKYIGGSCPNIACLPSKNVIRSAKANWFARHGVEYGIQTGLVSTDMKGVFDRKRKMVESEVQFHLDRFKATGAELIRGEAHFIAPKTVEVHHGSKRDDGSSPDGDAGRPALHRAARRNFHPSDRRRRLRPVAGHRSRKSLTATSLGSSDGARVQ